jgi:hypothetical protein
MMTERTHMYQSARRHSHAAGGAGDTEQHGVGRMKTISRAVVRCGIASSGSHRALRACWRHGARHNMLVCSGTKAELHRCGRQEARVGQLCSCTRPDRWPGLPVSISISIIISCNIEVSAGGGVAVDLKLLLASLLQVPRLHDCQRKNCLQGSSDFAITNHTYQLPPPCSKSPNGTTRFGFSKFASAHI